MQYTVLRGICFTHEYGITLQVDLAGVASAAFGRPLVTASTVQEIYMAPTRTKYIPRATSPTWLQGH
jgi:hypothetical protein